MPSTPLEESPPLTAGSAVEDRSTATAQICECLRSVHDEERRAALVDRLVLLNLGVAEAVAGRYRNRGVPIEDLLQTAYEGLVKAAARFDPGLDHDFLTYAVPTIRGEVQRHFRDLGWAVRPPRRIQDLQWRMHQAFQTLAQDLGRDPERGELVEFLDVEDGEVDEALQAYGCFRPTSLDQPVTPTSAVTLGELLPGSDPEIAASEARLTLAPVVRRLSERDRRILYLRFCEQRTQEEIGRELGVTQMQVSRLLSRIFNQLRADIGQPA